MYVHMARRVTLLLINYEINNAKCSSFLDFSNDSIVAGKQVTAGEIIYMAV